MEPESDALSGEDAGEKRDGGASEVGFVTEDNVSSYSIDDVLLPLPGWGVKLPNNQCELVVVMTKNTNTQTYLAGAL